MYLESKVSHTNMFFLSCNTGLQNDLKNELILNNLFIECGCCSQFQDSYHTLKSLNKSKHRFKKKRK